MNKINNELLYKHLRDTGLNYSEISREINISRNTIYNILLGKCSPSPQVIKIFVNFLKMSREEFTAVFYPNVQFKEEIKL